ncbi:MAG TPA: PilN domain-containing protein [Polyangiaceae bacterium]|nr:PilN domain-containing protein [Polyangiaceae bacterium]
MIKINLLPQKRRAEPTEGSQLWLAVVMVLFLAEVAGLFVFHGFKSEELKDQQRKNAELETQIQQSKDAVKNHPEVKAKLERLKARESAIENLQKARTGPTAVLLELARIMTPGRGPSVSPERLSQVRRDNPLAIYNSTWDPRRLWVTSYTEAQRKVRLEGLARDGEDVSELARRMNLSDYFANVTLLPAKQEKDQKSGLEMIKFALEAQVKY